MTSRKDSNNLGCSVYSEDIALGKVDREKLSNYDSLDIIDSKEEENQENNSFEKENQGSNQPIRSDEEKEEQKIILYPSTPADSFENKNQENNSFEKENQGSNQPIRSDEEKEEVNVLYTLKDDEVFRGIKVRLYPTKDQKKILEQTFGCSRFVYNKLLEERQLVYRRFKDDKTALHNYKYTTPAGLKVNFPFLRDVDSNALSNAQMNLNTAFKNFFKHGARYPKFKSKRNRQSYSTSNTNDNCKIDFTVRLLKLPRIESWIKFRDNRIFDEKIRKITVSRSRSGKFFASMMIVVENNVAVKNVIDREKIVGFDMSAKDFLITKEFRLSNPRFYRNKETKLKRLHRELSSKKKGLANRNRARIKLSRAYDKIANSKSDWTHKITYLLSKHFDCVILEDLNILGMQKFNSGLSKTVTLDFSWNQFKTILKYKLEAKGKHLKLVDRFFASSKICSECSCKNDGLELGDREWTCPTCGTLLERNINASVNIEEEGLRMLGEKNIKIMYNDYAVGSTVKAFGEDIRLTLCQQFSANYESISS